MIFVLQFIIRITDAIEFTDHLLIRSIAHAWIAQIATTNKYTHNLMRCRMYSGKYKKKLRIQIFYTDSLKIYFDQKSSVINSIAKCSHQQDIFIISSFLNSIRKMPF